MLFDQIIDTIENLNSNTVTEDRKTVLNNLIQYIQNKKNSDEASHINFICTHNSRRSHLAQIWAQTCAAFYNIPKLFCFSGGTEATKLYQTVKETLEEQGFVFKIEKKGWNPRFHIYFSNSEKPIDTFSKVYNHNVNPATNFAVVMTCSDADENCPIIPGAEKRISVMYEDPKFYDHSVLEKEKYKERSLQIATEMKYIFSNIK